MNFILSLDILCIFVAGYFCSIVPKFSKNLPIEELVEWQSHRPRSDSREYFEPAEVEDLSVEFDHFDDDGENDQLLLKVYDETSRPLSQESEMINGFLCQKCSPGFGLVAFCEAGKATICEPCRDGVNFSHPQPHFKPCVPCSRCGENMYTEIECTSELDTFCDSCQSIRKKNTFTKLLPSFDSVSGFWKKCVDGRQELTLDKIFRNLEKEDEDEDRDSVDEELEPESDDDEYLKPSIESEDDGDNSQIIPDLPIFPEIIKSEPEKDIEIIETTSITTTIAGFDETDVPPKPIAGSMDKLSSSLIGGYEVRLLPEPIGFDELEFDRPPVNKFGRKTQKRTKKTTSQPVTKMGNLEAIDLKSSINEINQEAIVFKPTNHDYPYMRLLHPDQFRAWMSIERQKVAAAAGLTVAIVLFFILLIMACRCSRRRKIYKNVKSGRHLIWAGGLTELEDKVIQECAAKMSKTEGKPYRSKFDKRRNPFDVENPEKSEIDDGKLVENPLADYLDQEDDDDQNEEIDNQQADHLINASTKRLSFEYKKGTKLSSIINV